MQRQGPHAEILVAGFLLGLLDETELLHLTRLRPRSGADFGEAGVAVLAREPAGVLAPADIGRFLIV